MRGLGKGEPFLNPLKYPGLDGADGGLGPVRYSKLGDYVLNVDLDGPAADQQVLGDLGVGLPLTEQPQYLDLPRRKALYLLIPSRLPSSAYAGLMCPGPGSLRSESRGLASFALYLPRFLLGCLTGQRSRSLLATTTLPREPYQELHRKLLVQRRLSFQSPPNRTQKPLPTGVLEHVARCPCLHSLKEVVWVLVHGYHHDGCSWHLLLDLPCGFESVHDWHPHIHEHQVGFEFSAGIESLSTIISFSDDFDTFFSREHGSKALSDQGVIICYE